MSLYLACLLTIAIETAYFFLIGYRGRDYMIICPAVNAATNLTLNLILRSTGLYGWIIVLLEVMAIAAEYAVFSLALKPSMALLLHTTAANILSYSVGGVLIRILF